jgi:crotonobetainyl-CoA:carnitine CoA-transferase CaiB-like acyl-CoA transferase
MSASLPVPWRRGNQGRDEAVSYQTPYTGLKVVDLSQGVAGPYCAMLLAQYGANVIKVEPTESGDWARSLGVRYGDNTAYSIPSNLGKRSIALDLKQAGGCAVLWRLIDGADIFLQGFRPGVIERLGFGYADVSAREPRILYVSVSGFGQTGPLSRRPAMDPVLQAYTGLMAENKGEDGIPHRIPIISIDMSTALYTFTAVAAALHARRDEAHGRHIESSLMQGAASLQVVRLISSYLEGGITTPVVPPNGVHKTADGWLSVTVVRPFEWQGYCRALDLPVFESDPLLQTIEGRKEHAVEISAVIQPLLASLPTAVLSQRLAAQRVMHEQLNTYTEFLRQKHVEESGAVAWLQHPHVPQALPLPNLVGLPSFVDGDARGVAPALGQHTDAILAEHGYSLTEIATLRAGKAVGAS